MCDIWFSTLAKPLPMALLRRLVLVLLSTALSRCVAQGFGGAGGADMDLGALFGALGGGGGGGAQGGGVPPICSKKELIVPRPLAQLKKGILIANGCGPSGMQMKEPFGLWRCCNRHDVCFSSCGTEAAFCERRYKACMKKRCRQPENAGKEGECDQQAQSMAGMSGMFGKGIHTSTMPEVCDCAKTKEEAKNLRRLWVKDVYQRFGPSDKAENATFIDELLQKNSGKEGKLFYELITKYGAAQGFVDFHDIPGSFELEGPSDMGPSKNALHDEM